MNGQIKSIPTTYDGIQFRSRLEAKYAAFFDLCGWKWSYEPEGFDGWIPDFSLGEVPTLVEVKPFTTADEWRECVQKIIKSGCRERVVLLGADPTLFAWDGSAPVFGWEWDGRYEGFQEIWEINFGRTEANGKLGLCSMIGKWDNCVWKDLSNKGSRVWLDEDGTRRILGEFWAHACNQTQWRPS